MKQEFPVYKHSSIYICPKAKSPIILTCYDSFITEMLPILGLLFRQSIYLPKWQIFDLDAKVDVFLNIFDGIDG